MNSFIISQIYTSDIDILRKSHHFSSQLALLHREKKKPGNQQQYKMKSESLEDVLSENSTASASYPSELAQHFGHRGSGGSTSASRGDLFQCVIHVEKFSTDYATQRDTPVQMRKGGYIQDVIYESKDKNEILIKIPVYLHRVLNGVSFLPPSAECDLARCLLPGILETWEKCGVSMMHPFRKTTLADEESSPKKLPQLQGNVLSGSTLLMTLKASLPSSDLDQFRGLADFKSINVLINFKSSTCFASGTSNPVLKTINFKTMTKDAIVLTASQSQALQVCYTRSILEMKHTFRLLDRNERRTVAIRDDSIPLLARQLVGAISASTDHKFQNEIHALIASTEVGICSEDNNAISVGLKEFDVISHLLVKVMFKDENTKSDVSKEMRVKKYYSTLFADLFIPFR